MQLLLVTKIALLVFFVASTNHLIFERLGGLFDKKNYAAIAVFLTIWALSLASLAIAAWLPSRWQRLAWALPLAASAFLGELNFGVAEAHLTFYDVVLYWAERPHWGDAAITYSLWFVSPLAKAGIGAVGFALPPVGSLPVPRVLAMTPLVPFLVISSMLLILDGKGTKALPSQYNAISMIAALVVSAPARDLSGPRRTILARPGPPLAKRIVLIVDESVRADFIDLNGARGVTPTLAAREQWIANFGYAVSGNNCSIFSNLILRFGGDPERLAESLRIHASIWAYATTAGFRSIYIDAQKVGGRLQNGMNVIERRQIDEFIQPDHVEATERDVFVARLLREMLARDERLFVYVNKKGTHFPYRGNYPSGAGKFLPDMGPAEPIGESRERLLNSYRNAIHWSTDRFFQTLLREGIPDATFLYTSDHGQNLMDRGVMLQCNSSNPHQLEGLVPMLAMSGDPDLAARFRVAARANRDRTTHFQIFPTLLQLMGYDQDATGHDSPASLLDTVGDRPLRFSYGPITGGTTREIKWREMPEELSQLVR